MRGCLGVTVTKSYVLSVHATDVKADEFSAVGDFLCQWSLCRWYGFYEDISGDVVAS